jgi:hypothetical protein
MAGLNRSNLGGRAAEHRRDQALCGCVIGSRSGGESTGVSAGAEDPKRTGHTQQSRQARDLSICMEGQGAVDICSE